MITWRYRQWQRRSRRSIFVMCVLARCRHINEGFAWTGTLTNENRKRIRGKDLSKFWWENVRRGGARTRVSVIRVDGMRSAQCAGKRTERYQSNTHALKEENSSSFSVCITLVTADRGEKTLFLLFLLSSGSNLHRDTNSYWLKHIFGKEWITAAPSDLLKNIFRKLENVKKT